MDEKKSGVQLSKVQLAAVDFLIAHLEESNKDRLEPGFLGSIINDVSDFVNGFTQAWQQTGFADTGWGDASVVSAAKAANAANAQPADPSNTQDLFAQLRNLQSQLTLENLQTIRNEHLKNLKK